MSSPLCFALRRSIHVREKRHRRGAVSHKARERITIKPHQRFGWIRPKAEVSTLPFDCDSLNPLFERAGTTLKYSPPPYPYRTGRRWGVRIVGWFAVLENEYVTFPFLVDTASRISDGAGGSPNPPPQGFRRERLCAPSHRVARSSRCTRRTSCRTPAPASRGLSRLRAGA